MAITTPFHGLLTELHILDDISTAPDMTTKVAEISSVGTLELTANIIEYNSYGSMYKQKLVGQKDSGTVSIGINWVAGDTSHTSLKAAYDNSGLLLFRINWISGSETMYCAFYGYVASYSIDTPVEDVVSANIDIAISGSVGFDGVEPQTSGGGSTPTPPAPAPAGGYDLSNSTDLNKTFNYSSQDSQAYGMAFNNDGTKWYMFGTSTVRVYEYTLSTAYDISTATYSNVSASGLGLTPNFTDFRWKPDGTKIYFLQYSNNRIYTCTASTPWDITTIAFDTPIDPMTTSQGTDNLRFTFNDDGTKLFSLSRNDGALYAYSLSTAWDITSGTYANDSLVLYPLLGVTPAASEYLRGVEFSASGHKLFITNYNSSTTSPNNAVFEIDLATAWDIETATHSGVKVQLPPTYGLASGVLFNGDGTQVYVNDVNSDQVVTFSSGS